MFVKNWESLAAIRVQKSTPDKGLSWSVVSEVQKNMGEKAPMED